MAEPNINQQIAARVRQIRTKRALSLEVLAEQSGVSRSMISLIERGEASPTAVVLEKLAAGLNMPLAALFEPRARASGPVALKADQPVWRDPGSGYLRRNVSPSGDLTPIRIVEVEFPAGARVAYESGSRQTPIHHQVWVLDGTIDVTIGDEWYALESGDCLAFVLDQPTTYHNVSNKPARYAVVMTS